MTHAIIDYHGNTVDIPRQKDVKRKLNREMIWDLIRRRKSLGNTQSHLIIMHTQKHNFMNSFHTISHNPSFRGAPDKNKNVDRQV